MNEIQMPEGNEPNPGRYYRPYKKPERTPYAFVPGDAIFACFTLVLGFLCWEFTLFSGLGTFIVLILALVCTMFYLRSRGAVQTSRSIPVFITSIAGALPFLLFDTLPVHILPLLLVLCTCFFWVLVSTGNTADDRLSGFVISDWVNQTFVVPFSNILGLFICFRNATKDTGRAKTILIGAVGLCIAIPLIAGITSLLVKSDQGFAQFAEDFAKWVSIDDIGSYIAKFIGGVPIACYIFGAVSGNIQKRYTGRITKEGAEKTLAAVHRIPYIGVLTPLAVLCIIYIVYITVMSVYLFSAFANKLPEGLAVYANYARSGFFELCAVAAINLFILIFTYAFVKRETGELPKVIRFLAALLSIMTELLVITAISKMLLYIDAYGLSRLRMFTLWFLVLLAIVFVILIVWHVRIIYNHNAGSRVNRIGKGIILVTVGMILLLSFANTDAIIAKHNLWQYQTGKSRAPDTEMLAGMSDAVLPYLAFLQNEAPNYGEALKARDAITRINNRHARDLRLDKKSAFKNWSVQKAITKKYLPEDQSGMGTGIYITIKDVHYSTDLYELDLSGRQLKNEDIAPLIYMTNLTDLYLGNNEISDLTPLSGLTNLTGLVLDYNQISDLTPLSDLINLKGLTLTKNKVKDLTPLKSLANLTSLALDQNEISDLRPVAGLTKLTWLRASSNRIKDISPLSGLNNLIWLSLNHNKISDLSPLSGLTKLKDVALTANEITDLSPLSGLTDLTWLDLSKNKISDLTPLPKLTGLTYTNLEQNDITDWEPARYTRNVQGRP